MKGIINILICALTITLSSCMKDSYDSDTTGTGGSMARFTIKGNYLYAVDFDNLQVFEITNPSAVSSIDHQYVGFGIETIFPAGNHLFLGARNGMYIYSLQDPLKPKRISYTPHFVSYDPVVVQDNYAYVTLRQGDGFGGWGNLLQIYDISKLERPVLLKEYSMWGPRGLGIDGDKLFICDDKLKVYHLKTPSELELIESFEVNAIDVIPDGETLYVIAEDGFYQYSYANGSVTLISKITIPKNQ
jgi:hypothetical protein